MDDLMRRVKALDPAPGDAELPTGMWSADVLLESIDAGSGTPPTRRHAARPAIHTRRSRWGPAVGIAAAAFALVIVIGIATAVIIGGTDRSGPVDQPTPTTLPTTTLPPTTALPTTAPPTSAAATTVTTLATTATTVVDNQPVTVTRDVAYSTTQPLDVWAPTSPGPWPVLVMLHGPAYTDNVRSGYDPLAESISAGGVVVFNAEWPQRDEFLSEAETVACAVGFARSTAAEYGGSPDRVTLFGHSNGGSMAATVALAAELLDPVDGCAVTDASIVPNALVGVAGDYDYAMSGVAAEFREIDPAAWEIVDPYTNIGRNPDLEVYLLHGDGDDAVSAQSAIDFHQALQDAGYDATLNVLSGVGHNSLVAPSFDAFQETVAVALEAARG